MKNVDMKKPGGSSTKRTRLLTAKAEKAGRQAKAARQLAHLAKQRLKQARKAFKMVKKAARQARKEAKAARKALAAATMRAATAKPKSKANRKPSKARARLTAKTRIDRKERQTKLRPGTKRVLRPIKRRVIAKAPMVKTMPPGNEAAPAKSEVEKHNDSAPAPAPTEQMPVQTSGIGPGRAPLSGPPTI